MSPRPGNCVPSTHTQRRITVYLPLLLAICLLSAHHVQAQDIQAFNNLLESREKAVLNVAAEAERVLATGAWCSSAPGCSDTPCAQHACNGFFGESASCIEDFALKSCTGARSTNEGICSSDETPTGILLDQDVPNIRTPPGSITSEGEGAAIIIDEPVLRRDICALKRLNETVIGAYKENNLKFWLYAGTENKAVVFMPGKSICRDTTSSPLRDCGYDPTVRPWYISAGSGPRDIVFLFDVSSLSREQSHLRSSLATVLRGLDSQDFIALVAYGSESATMVGGAEDLQGASTEVVNGLLDELDELPAENRPPDTTAAFRTAFDLLHSADTSGNSSNCSKLIVLISGDREDVCFENCKNEPLEDCRCVQCLNSRISSWQSSLSSPATIVTFSESQTDKVDRLSRTLACTEKARGIWRRVSSEDTDSAALSTFSKTISASNFEERPNLFSSQLYEDDSGLGSIFTLARPIYELDERRLVGVAGADVTLQEVIEAVGSESTAREQIRMRNAEERVCPESRDLSGTCDLQVLRSQPGSAICAPFLPTNDCYQLGSDTYYNSIVSKAHNESLADCERFGNGATLAKLDTAAKNAFVSGFASLDGNWIGLRAKMGEGFKWSDGSVLTTDQFGFDGNAAAAEVHETFNTDACVSVDHRGVTENWSVEPCFSMRQYICQLNGTSEIADSECGNTFVSGEAEYEGPNPIDCPNISAGTVRRCSSEQDEQIKAVDPLCVQSGIDFTEQDRTCCGGRAGFRMSEDAEGGKKRIGVVIGIIISVVVVLIVFILVIVRRKRALREKKLTKVVTTERLATTFSDEEASGRDLSDISMELPEQLWSSLQRDDCASSTPSRLPRQSEETQTDLHV